MPAYLSGLCRRLGKNKRIQRWLDRQVCRTPAHVELTVPLMTTWRYLTGPLEVDKSITSCKKMPDPLFCPLLDRGEKPGHVIRVVPEVKEEQENAAVAAPASLPSTGPCGAHGASTGRLEYLWGLLESFCFIVSGCVSCHLNLVPAHVELTVPLGD